MHASVCLSHWKPFYRIKLLPLRSVGKSYELYCKLEFSLPSVPWDRCAVLCNAKVSCQFSVWIFSSLQPWFDTNWQNTAHINLYARYTTESFHFFCSISLVAKQNYTSILSLVVVFFFLKCVIFHMNLKKLPNVWRSEQWSVYKMKQKLKWGWIFSVIFGAKFLFRSTKHFFFYRLKATRANSDIWGKM